MKVKNAREEVNKEIIKCLEEKYAGAKTALKYNNSFELLIATILSAQTTDNQVNKITSELFRKYPGPQDFRKLTSEGLAEEIRGCGLYRTKAKNILATINILLDEYQGEVPADFEKLLKLPGVGRKTANVVLANAFGLPGLGVDTHVLRVANRLGLAKAQTPLQAELQLKAQIDPSRWGEAHHWLIWHGRRICTARKPKCAGCFLNSLCDGYKGSADITAERPDRQDKKNRQKKY